MGTRDGDQGWGPGMGTRDGDQGWEFKSSMYQGWEPGMGGLNLVCTRDGNQGWEVPGMGGNLC
jgi:hypothetical protein